MAKQITGQMPASKHNMREYRAGAIPSLTIERFTVHRRKFNLIVI